MNVKLIQLGSLRLSNSLVAQSENIKHSYRMGRRNYLVPIEGRAVGSGVWTWYESQIEAARKLGLPSRPISACCRRSRRSIQGYEFRLVKNNVRDNDENEEWREVILPESLRQVFSRGGSH